MNKVHFRYPIFWTACNLAARRRALGSKIRVTSNKALVTCGSCRNTQGFFTMDDKPDDVVTDKTPSLRKDG